MNIHKKCGAMKTLTSVIFFLIFCVTVALGQSGVSNTPAAPGGDNVTAASNSLRILSPKVGEKIGSSSVDVRYELTNTNADAAASPTYRVQLDSRDPSETLDTEYNFTGLAPGAHTVYIELVDANHTPIAGSQAVVHFTTFVPGVNGTTNKSGGTTPGPTSSVQRPHTEAALAPPQVVKANLPLPSRNELPNSGGELPLLSMVGFGVLVGGVISAMRARKQ